MGVQGSHFCLCTELVRRHSSHWMHFPLFTPRLDFPGGSVVKNIPANARDVRDTSLIPRSGRPPGGEHGNPLQYSCLENPMDREAWQVMICKIAKSPTQLKQLGMHAPSILA